MFVYCDDCGRKLADGTPRVVIKGRFVCGDCVYHREVKK